MDPTETSYVDFHRAASRGEVSAPSLGPLPSSRDHTPTLRVSIPTPGRELHLARRFRDTFFCAPPDTWVSKREAEDGSVCYRLVETEDLQDGLFVIKIDLQDEAKIIEHLNATEFKDEPIARIEDLGESSSFYFDREVSEHSVFDQLVIRDKNRGLVRVGPVLHVHDAPVDQYAQLLKSGAISKIQLWCRDYRSSDLAARVASMNLATQVRYAVDQLHKRDFSWTYIFNKLNANRPEQWLELLNADLENE